MNTQNTNRVAASDHVPALGSSTPIAGEATTQRVRRAPRPLISKRLIAIGFVVASVTAGVVLWLKDQIESRAAAAEVISMRDRQSAVERQLAGIAAQVGWMRADVVEMKAVLWRLAAREGLALPPAPSSPAPLAPPVAP
jgi:hypothetical protein